MVAICVLMWHLMTTKSQSCVFTRIFPLFFSNQYEQFYLKYFLYLQPFNEKNWMLEDK